MRRRSVLIGTVALAAATAGCADVGIGPANDGSDDSGGAAGPSDSDDAAGANDSDENGAAASGGGRSPAEVVRAFQDAVGDGDAATLRTLVHPDHDLPGSPEEYARRGASTDIEAVRTETVASDDGTAFVETSVTYREPGSEAAGDGGESVDFETVYELRTHEGAWRVYADRTRVPLAYRLGDVSPADSFETTIGTAAADAEPFFDGSDVTAVDLTTRSGVETVAVTVATDRAEAIRETVAGFDDAAAVEVYEYLDGEHRTTRELQPGLVRSMADGSWAAAPEFAFTYEDAGLAERVAATLLDRVED